MRMSRLIPITVLALVAALALAVPASGHIVRYARGVSGSFNPSSGPPYDSASGVVTSGNPRCKHRSLVTLWKVNPGADLKIGADSTGGGVSWFINPPGNFSSGSYYLTVKRKVLVRRAGHKHSCPFLRTNSFAVTNP